MVFRFYVILTGVSQIPCLPPDYCPREDLLFAPLSFRHYIKFQNLSSNFQKNRINFTTFISTMAHYIR